MHHGLKAASVLTRRNCIVTATLVALTILAAPGPATAQSAKTSRTTADTTASLPSRTATTEQRQLQAGPIAATVTVLRSVRPFPAGGSAFATLELSASGKSRLEGTELRLEPVSAEIRNVTGDYVTVEQNGSARVARVTGKLKQQKLKLVVELALGRTASDSPNSLKITLRNPDGGEAATSLDWMVADCASGFYSEIVKVRNGSGSTIERSLAAARKKNPERPGRWLFQPTTASAARRGKCLKSVRRWSSRRGRYFHVCTQFEQISTGATAASIPYEGKVYNFAARLVRSRASDHELLPGRDSGWATTRVSQNLKGFLAQENHPALCTGTLQVFDYFDERMQGFLARAQTYDTMRTQSHALALLRVVEVADAAQTSSTGHPGWGNSPLLPGTVTADLSLKKMTERAAALTGDVALGESVAQADTAFGALKLLAEYMKSEDANSLDKELRSALDRGLGAIEAAEYIEAVADHYGDLRHALSGSMQTLREAHSEKCKCSG